MLEFGFLDIAIVVVFLFFSIFSSYFLTRKKQKTLKEHFQSTGKLSWFISGTGMVATTFAADTPLAVTELVYESGIAGNWVWWYGAIGSIITVYIFAPLWKRTGVTTDVAFIHLRYSGIGADILRIARSVYLGLFLNVLIMAWVNLAIFKIISVLFPAISAEWFVSALFFLAFLYTSLMGLSGISYADTFQFFFAMLGCIALAIVVLQVPEVGGIAGIKEKIAASKLSFIPNFSPTGQEKGMPFGDFLVLVLVVWWASWYPGAEPGGGGYIAQRILAAKDERSSTLATLWFTIAHYFIRPWPWILVALASLILFPALAKADRGKSYIMTLQYNSYPGINGILLATFIAAYLSTIATHLNWGASYLVNDLYKPYLVKEKDDRHYLNISVVCQLVMMLFSLLCTFYLLDSISGVWKFLISGSAGVGFILLARWFYWRINAWAEIAAFILPLCFYAIGVYVFSWKSGSYQIILFCTFLTVFATLCISFFTQPTQREVLSNFYKQVKPPGLLWQSWAKRNNVPNITSPDFLSKSLGLSALGIVLVISGLFMLGYLIFAEWQAFAISAGLFVLSAGLTYKFFPAKKD
ncbi:MAG: sodium:solute symporter family protein [Spirochaetota bacterium]